MKYLLILLFSAQANSKTLSCYYNDATNPSFEVQTNSEANDGNTLPDYFVKFFGDMDTEHGLIKEGTYPSWDFSAYDNTLWFSTPYYHLRPSQLNPASIYCDERESVMFKQEKSNGPLRVYLNCRKDSSSFSAEFTVGEFNCR